MSTSPFRAARSGLRLLAALALVACADEYAPPRMPQRPPQRVADGNESPAAAGARGSLAAGDHDRSLDFEGHAHAYRLHVPAGAEAPMPLVLALHGLHADGPAMQHTTGLDEVAESAGFATLYPTYEGGTWNLDQAAHDDVIGMLRALVAAVARDLPIDKRRIYVTGLSTGALLTQTLACEAADLFAAAAPVAAPLALRDEACKPARPISIMHVHGTMDTFVGFDGGGLIASALFPDRELPSASASSAGWARRNGCAREAGAESAKSDWPEAPISGAALASSKEWVFFSPPSTPGASCAWYGDCEADVEVGLCSHDGQHDWPSGSSRAIWSFFTRHRLPERVLPRSPDEARYRSLKRASAAAAQLDATQLKARYVPKFQARLSYDPNAAEFLDRIQASPLALSNGERQALGQNGFVISTRREFPTFMRGLAEIYTEHLPLYVTADALFESVHRSYRFVLEALERSVVAPELLALLRGMLSRLPAAQADARTIADVDLYLSVALGLLSGETPAPSTGTSVEAIQQLLRLALAAEGKESVTLFGTERAEDFSQFKPRGHYAASLTLQQYFRALIWLGRVDLRLLETQGDGALLFRRDQYDAMLLLHELAAPDLARFARIEAVLRGMVGESDAMTLAQVPQLVAELGGGEAARAKSDAQVVEAIVTGGYGKQQIASALIDVKAPETLPLNRSFALIAQRYVVDAHVLSETVHDRVENRMLPSPLDAAFAALGNGQALAYEADLERSPELPGALARMRVLVDAHEPEFWQANLYNLWLLAIRGLSPASDLRNPSALGLPAVFGSEAWGRRVLNTQLGAWSELRHDTQVYAKQSYSGGGFCEYPDAYVDPYPAVYEALHSYALAGLKLSELVDPAQTAIAEALNEYFRELARVTDLLRDMALRELRGEPFSAEQLTFINEAVEIEANPCIPDGIPRGWYAKLFVLPASALTFDPVIADVHTQPSDAAGTPVGNVLHVGTGYPRLMVTTVDTCHGPRAYAGVVYAYHERVTGDFERLSDQQWAKGLQSGQRPAETPWIAPVLAR